MPDMELILVILSQIYQSTQTILQRSAPINSADDFLDSETGREKLDSICMQLITIGESLKNLDKVTNNSLLIKYPQIDWKKAKGMRDIISHQYFDLDADIIYDVCKNHVPLLADIIKKIIKEV
jgi:uncharacterized protein with HEPN domain